MKLINKPAVAKVDSPHTSVLIIVQQLYSGHHSREQTMHESSFSQLFSTTRIIVEIRNLNVYDAGYCNFV